MSSHLNPSIEIKEGPVKGAYFELAAHEGLILYLGVRATEQGVEPFFVGYDRETNS